MNKMLIVEDDDLSQKVMRRIFQFDYILDFCESAEEYYEKCSLIKYDIIIMDVSLKGTKNGLELTKEIKEAQTYTGTPILCLTAHAQTEMREKAIESGADFFLTKPVPTNVLKDAAASLIKNSLYQKHLPYA